jgi:hypothetical protein
MNATDNITSAWNEVIPNCLHEVWKKLRPEVCSNIQKSEEETLIQNIVEMAKEAGLEGVNEDNIQEWLQSHGKF